MSSRGAAVGTIGWKWPLYRRAPRLGRVEGLPGHARRKESRPTSLRPSACTIVVKGEEVDARSILACGRMIASYLFCLDVYALSKFQRLVLVNDFNVYKLMPHRHHIISPRNCTRSFSQVGIIFGDTKDRQFVPLSHIGKVHL